MLSLSIASDIYMYAYMRLLSVINVCDPSGGVACDRLLFVRCMVCEVHDNLSGGVNIAFVKKSAYRILRTRMLYWFEFTAFNEYLKLIFTHGPSTLPNHHLPPLCITLVSIDLYYQRLCYSSFNQVSIISLSIVAAIVLVRGSVLPVDSKT